MVSLPTTYQQFIHLSRYARWIEDKGRRETWEETVDRYIGFMCDKQCRGKISKEDRDDLRQAILNLEVMPSMRCLMTAGRALERDHVAAYNCSYLAIDDPKAFDELLYILMCVPEDTWVSTSFGPRQVKDLIGRAFVAQVEGRPYMSRTGFFKTGEKRIRMIDASGFEVRVTDNHKIMTEHGWKRADEIVVGDKIALGDPGMKPWDGDGSEDEGYLLGYFVGDGNFGHLGKMELSSYEPDDEASEMRFELERIVLSLPGRKDRQGWSWDVGKNGYRMIDRQGANLAKRFGLKPGHKVVGPEIEKGSYDFYIGFLRGVMDADGSVLSSSNDRSMRLKWVDRTSLQAVQRMLARIGIKSRIVDGPEERDEEIRGKMVRCKKQWVLIISGENRERYAELIGFWNSNKREAVNSAVREGYVSERYVQVTSNVEIDEVVPVYDVQVDEVHAFDGNGLKLHNCGTGVGFSVERQYIAKMPMVAEKLRPSKTVISVEDSKIGWANAFRELISMLYQGRIPRWDVSEVRPKGARLKTFGGRSSGPQPLVDLFRFTIDIFRGAEGRQLNSMECHDICCKVGDVVVVGGVRRSALISLSNPSDDRMRHAKSGNWWETAPWRQLANNSICYTEKPEMAIFMREWLALYDSKSGERGIFNREAAKKWSEKMGRRDSSYDFGCNPCSEIILRSCGFCNLSEVVVREYDDEDSLKRKVRLATILGTMQATLTDFRYLRDVWKHNAEEEALLGVSLTGIMDNKLMSGEMGKRPLAKTLERLRDYTVKVNKEWAKKLGINPATASTCQKPSGTVSQLVNCASGGHARYAPYYIRRVRADKKDPLAILMADMGFPVEDDISKPDDNWVFSFPVKSPDGAITTDQLSSIKHLELWKTYQLYWCEHKPSVTVHLKEHEWMDAGAWVYENFDIVSGISFLPYSGHSYNQAPYEECTEEEYKELLEKMPEDVDWSRLSEFEVDDNTVETKTYACTGDNGSCEIVDLVK